MLKAIAVIGPYRGGTSLVTGILRRLGVFIGSSFVNARTGYCTFEDIELRRSCLKCFDERSGVWNHLGCHEERVGILRKWLQDAMLAAHGEGAVACGGKHPVFCKLVPELAEAWSIPNSSEFIALRIDRDIDAIHQSWTRSTGPDGRHWWPRKDREFIVRDLIDARDRALSKFHHLSISFESLRANPKEAIRFLADRLDLPRERVDDAVALVGA